MNLEFFMEFSIFHKALWHRYHHQHLLPRRRVQLKVESIGMAKNDFY